jgi:hypothetical protein
MRRRSLRTVKADTGPQPRTESCSGCSKYLITTPPQDGRAGGDTSGTTAVGTLTLSTTRNSRSSSWNTNGSVADHYGAIGSVVRVNLQASLENRDAERTLRKRGLFGMLVGEKFSNNRRGPVATEKRQAPRKGADSKPAPTKAEIEAKLSEIMTAGALAPAEWIDWARALQSGGSADSGTWYFPPSEPSGGTGGGGVRYFPRAPIQGPTGPVPTGPPAPVNVVKVLKSSHRIRAAVEAYVTGDDAALAIAMEDLASLLAES